MSEVNVSAFIDKITNSKKSISQEHHEIHEGHHYNIAGYATLALNDVVEFIVTPPTTLNKLNHLIFDIQSTAGITLDVYRGPTTIVGGTPITPVNNNENFTDNSETTVLKDPTSIGDDGTFRSGYGAGSNLRAGFISRDKELVLKFGSVYLFRVTSLNNSNFVSWAANFYEHTNKNLDN